MKFSARRSPLRLLQTDLLALGVLKGQLFSPRARELDRQVGGILSRLLKEERFLGKAGETRLLDTQGKVGAKRLLLVGLGEEVKPNGELLRKVAAWTVRGGNKLHARKVALEDLPLPGKGITPEERAQAIAEGSLLAGYRFERYKTEGSENSERTVREVEVLTEGVGDWSRGFQRGVVFGEATNFARDLVNVPASDMTPRRMAEEARKIGKLPRLSAKIFDRHAVKKMGMGCLLAVARGSEEPPYFLHLIYRPSGRSRKRIALIGKGITFDSGGLSLKTASSMETMKIDMSGAAAMLGALRALSVLKPPVEVHGVAAVTENMPSGRADKPGDVARSMGGKTVEILNTDAEGRLILADALFYVRKQRPDLIIDVATLTGACVIALGELCSGVMGNNQGLIDRLIESGKKAGEKLWQLPLIEEYKEDLKSSVADLKNVGGKWGGTINGALFLQEFVDPKIPWAHIDIAGPSWTEKELSYCPRGGTGHIVRTLLHFILSKP